MPSLSDLSGLPDLSDLPDFSFLDFSIGKYYHPCSAWLYPNHPTSVITSVMLAKPSTVDTAMLAVTRSCATS